MSVALDLTVDLDLTLGPPKLFERRARDPHRVPSARTRASSSPTASGQGCGAADRSRRLDFNHPDPAHCC
jgi:hypothetical protein